MATKIPKYKKGEIVNYQPDGNDWDDGLYVVKEQIKNEITLLRLDTDYTLEKNLADQFINMKRLATDKGIIRTKLRYKF